MLCVSGAYRSWPAFQHRRHLSRLEHSLQSEQLEINPDTPQRFDPAHSKLAYVLAQWRLYTSHRLKALVRQKLKARRTFSMYLTDMHLLAYVLALSQQQHSNWTLDKTNRTINFGHARLCIKLFKLKHNSAVIHWSNPAVDRCHSCIHIFHFSVYSSVALRQAIRWADAPAVLLKGCWRGVNPPDSPLDWSLAAEWCYHTTLDHAPVAWQHHLQQDIAYVITRPYLEGICILIRSDLNYACSVQLVSES